MTGLLSDHESSSLSSGHETFHLRTFIGHGFGHKELAEINLRLFYLGIGNAGIQ